MEDFLESFCAWLWIVLSVYLPLHKQTILLFIYLFFGSLVGRGGGGFGKKGGLIGWLVGGAASASWFIKKNQVFSSCMKLYLFINSFFFPSSFRFGFSSVLFPNITSRPGNRTGSVLRRLGCCTWWKRHPTPRLLAPFPSSALSYPPPLPSTGLCSVVSS